MGILISRCYRNQCADYIIKFVNLVSLEEARRTIHIRNIHCNSYVCTTMVGISVENIQRRVQRFGTKTRKRVKNFERKSQHVCGRHGIEIPGLIEALIWAVGVAVFTGLTVKYSVPLLSTYFDDDANVQIQTKIVLSENTTSNQDEPHFVLRIPHYYDHQYTALMNVSFNLFKGYAADESECPECVRLANASWDVWRSMDFTNATVHDVFNKVMAAFVRKLLSEIENGRKDTLNEANSDWNGPILVAAIYFLVWKHHVDVKFVIPFDSSSGDISAMDAEYSSSRGNRTHVYELLYESVLIVLCRRSMNLAWQSTGPGDQTKTLTCEDIVVNGTLPVMFHTDHVLIPFENRYNFYSTLTWESLESHDRQIWIPGTGLDDGFTEKADIFSEPLLLYYTDIDGDLMEGMYMLTTGILSDAVQPSITITYSVQIKTNEERSGKLNTCSHESNIKTCVAKCSKEWIRRHCECQPFSFRPRHQPDSLHLPYCDKNSYNVCDPIKNYNGTGKEECLKTCYSPCTYLAYTYNVISEDTEIPNGSLGCQVILRHVTTPFIQFTNKTKDGQEEMISQLGGALGVWLGLSGLSILQFVLACTDFIRRRRKHSKLKKVWTLSLFRAAILNTLQVTASSKDDDDDDNGKDQDATQQTDDENNNTDQDDQQKPDDDTNGTDEQIEKLTLNVRAGFKNDIQQMKDEMIQVLKNEIGRVNQLLQDHSEDLQNQSKLLKGHSKTLKVLQGQRKSFQEDQAKILEDHSSKFQTTHTANGGNITTLYVN